MSLGLFRIRGLKVFLSEGLSLRAAVGVLLTNMKDGKRNDGRSSLIPGRNGKTREDLFGVMIKDVLLSSFKYSALVDETPTSVSTLLAGIDSASEGGLAASWIWQPGWTVWNPCDHQVTGALWLFPAPRSAFTSWPLWWCGWPYFVLCRPNQSWTWL